jgi:hypothetical protein
MGRILCSDCHWMRVGRPTVGLQRNEFSPAHKMNRASSRNIELTVDHKILRDNEMSPDRIKLLVHARRISGLLEGAIRNGPDGTLEGNFGTEHPLFVHHTLIFYLAGCMAYLENEDGLHSWHSAGVSFPDFDQYIASLPHDHRFQLYGVSKGSLDALVCIRNACVHNGCDLSLNRDRNSIGKVNSASVSGVSLSGTSISLQQEFLEFVRLSTIAVRAYHGDT